LVLVPSLLIGLAGLCAYFKLGFILFAVIAWSVWHGAMQILGFLRIYDAKAGMHSRLTARLDFWICITWFVQVLMESPGRLSGVFSSFYLAGGPLLPVAPVHGLIRFWEMATWAVTAAYVMNALYQGFWKGYWNLPKWITLVFALVFWSFCMVGIGNILIGLIMWEIYHDLQYNVFVWKYNQSRVEKGMSRSALERFLFRPDFKTMVLYALCIILYGTLGLFSQDIANIYQHESLNGSALSRIGNVFAASALIHFYFDGFIWKVRDANVQKDLGIDTGKAAVLQRSAWLHVVLVTAFFTTGFAMALSEYRWKSGSGASSGRPADNLADLVPRSGYANFMQATRLRSENKLDSAALYYSRAIEMDTAYAFSHAFLGDLEMEKANWPKALSHYELAVKADPEALPLLENLAHLYMRNERYADAQAAFEALQSTDSSNAEYPFQIGYSLLQRHKGISAKPFLLRSLGLKPEQPVALNYLGMVEQASGQIDSARALYLRALEMDSTYDMARANLNSLSQH
jgi:tetratricopeptide (TPR) repeat protein